MNQKLTGLLATAIITGLLTGATAHAEEKPAAGSEDKAAAEKNSCKGHKAGDKNGCKGHKADKKHKDKNSCKNGCGGEAHDKSETKE